MKVALLVDQMCVTRWQAEAIGRIGGDVELIVYNCRNTSPSPRQVKHYPYYLLSLLSLRSALTRRVALGEACQWLERVDFESELDGRWQRLPPRLIDRIRADRPDAIVKFGLGLLRVPDGLGAPILSFHHGDPRRFRGRPAGFYELLGGEKVVGQVVQILSNRLDAGQVVAFAETPIRRHNYRATMSAAYRASPLLLEQALRRAIAGEVLDIPPSGKVYRLPSLPTVLRFAVQRFAAKGKRLAYGAFVEKSWEVAQTPFDLGHPPSLAAFPAKERWQIIKRPRGYSFLADPFPHPAGAGLLVEAMSTSTGLGEILHIEGERSRTLVGGNGHYSYPATLTWHGSTLMVPETCQWSPPKLFRIGQGGAECLGILNVKGSPRLVDPTLIARDGGVFLFANDYSEGDFVLRLWVADDVAGPLEEHPHSPILVSPCGGRMGGALIDGEALYRLGQDGSDGYGNGVVLFRVDELSRQSYRETRLDGLRFAAVNGPHTLNFSGGQAIFDFYTDRFTPLAGVQRLRNRFASR